MAVEELEAVEGATEVGEMAEAVVEATAAAATAAAAAMAEEASRVMAAAMASAVGAVALAMEEEAEAGTPLVAAMVKATPKMEGSTWASRHCSSLGTTARAALSAQQC